MAIVFNEEIVKKVCDENSIVCDLSSQASIDATLGKLAVATCSEENWLGCGIDRNAFDLGNCVLKIDKEFYVSTEDQDAYEDYIDTHYEGEDDYPDTYSFNHIEDASDSTVASDQGITEIENYCNVLEYGLDGSFAQIYAATSNGNIILMEKCNTNFYDLPDCFEILEEYDNLYCDIHEDNVGLNHYGNLVILDSGFEFNWDKIVEKLGIPKIVND